MVRTLVAGGLFSVLAAATTAADDPKHDHNRMMADKCAAACSDCQRACAMCTAHCTGMVAEGKKEHVVTLKTCRDCADVCAVAASIVARQGPFSDTICKACADACARCGAECDKFANDPHMKQCADECKKCEKACREMLAHAANAK